MYYCTHVPLATTAVAIHVLIKPRYNGILTLLLYVDLVLDRTMIHLGLIGACRYLEMLGYDRLDLTKTVSM